MSVLSAIAAIVKFLPELFEFVGVLVKKIDDGIEDAVIRRSIKRINKAFANPNRAEAARQLDEEFTKKLGNKKEIKENEK